MTRDDWYDNAQICLNGHIITNFAESNPNSCENFCNKCGEKTIRNCPDCEESIRGYHHMEGLFSRGNSHPPNFCINCGKPYPWTLAKISAAKELAQTLNELSMQQKQDLEKNIDDIVRDTPRTKLLLYNSKIH